jgi:glycosyltransferase involved in cell wall biosynthesis
MDASSYLERKNPAGIMELYRRLRMRNPYKRFVFALKIKEREGSSKVAKSESLLRDPNFIVIDRNLAESEMTGLFSLSDSFVSLHRAEGFGRGVGEAMSQGLPVIATGYSGVLDMMTGTNSWPLPYQLVPVQEGEYPHHADQVWADPDIDAAVAACEEVMNMPEERKRRVRRASLDLETQFSHAAVGLRMSDRLSQIAADG